VTINDLIRTAGQYPWHVLALFSAPPLFALLTGWIHRTPARGASAPFRHVYSGLIYAVTVPGMLAAVLTGYGLFFLRADLRSVPVLLYFLPIVSMLITWSLIRSRVDLDHVPGFERLSALMVSVALCFALAFAINRLFFGVLFFGSLWGLLLVALAGFIALRVSFRKALR
jgi:hypothetical protein